MTMRSWIRQLFARPHRPICRAPVRPRLEALEDRLAPATYHVTSLLDDGSAGTLRAAITQANANPGADTIDFAVTGTITLNGTQLPTITDDLTVSGPGAASLTLDAHGASRVFQVNASVTVALSGLTIANGSADHGGGIRNDGVLTLNAVALSGNQASNNDGGGIYNLGTLTVTGSIFSGNSAPFGGAIRNGGTVAVTNSTLSGNSASADGGGIENYGGTLTVTDSTLSGNSARYDGGAIRTSGTLAVTNSTLSGNSATNHGGGIDNVRGTLTVTDSTLSGNSTEFGGGLDNGGTLAVTNSTLSGNFGTFGGGIFNNVGTVAVTNSTLSGNSSFVGGGIDNYVGTVAVTNSTLSGNSGFIIGGGIRDDFGTVTLNNSIVANSPSGGDVGGGLSGGHNLFGAVALGPLADNGGPTQTMALPAGSPAIDAGDNALAVDANGQPLTTDQRGMPVARIQGGTVDIGAFESQDTATAVRASPDPSTYGQAVTVTATVTSGASPVTGGTATFTEGATVLASAVPLDASGQASFTTAALPAGSHTITASFSGATGLHTSSGSVDQTVSPAPLSATGVNISATAGAPFSGIVATFTNADPFGSAASYTALINWGDGSTSAGVISGTGTLTVTGSHTYADPINEPVQVTISHNLGDTTTATTKATATVTSLGLGVSTGQTAGIGFWQNTNGQALIASFNGGSTSTMLSAWLASTFPNLYGTSAGGNNLTGKSNAQVAAFYLTLFAQSGPKVDAEVLAAALNVYATTQSLGGNAGVAYGFAVTANGLGASSVNVGADGAAFSVANNTTRNVYQLLLAVNRRAANGVLYNGDATLRQQASDLFDALNSAGGL
jgi:predicted outer membrane repeat protein